MLLEENPYPLEQDSLHVVIFLSLIEQFQRVSVSVGISLHGLSKIIYR